jgi:hypothetical protein
MDREERWGGEIESADGYGPLQVGEVILAFFGQNIEKSKELIKGKIFN